jgi:phospholipase A1
MVFTIVLAAAALAAEPTSESASPQPDAIAACRALRTDQERLACYDRLFGAPEGALVEQTPSPPAQPVEVRQSDSLLNQRWELTEDQKQGTFRVAPHKPVYILAAFHSSSTNEAPSSPSEDHSVDSPLDIRPTETKFQISLKSKLWEDQLGQPADLWFG